MKLLELLTALPQGSLTYPASTEDCDIRGIQHDSRLIKPGFLFIAYPGVTTDGREYIDQAVHSGAAAIVYESAEFPASIQLPASIPCIPVSHLSAALAIIASRFYHHPSLSLAVTGVTGTNGKTTIAYQLAQASDLLESPAVYLGTLGHGKVNHLTVLNNTTPDALCLQALLYQYKGQGIQQVCMEVSSHALSEHRVDCIEFNQAIFTNLSHDHLDYHRTMDAYADAKAQLFAKATLEWAIINHDDAYASRMISGVPASCKKLTYGLQHGADVRAADCQFGLLGSHFDVSSPWGEQHLEIHSVGVFNIYNSLAVYSSLLAYGYPIERVVSVMAKLNPSPGRLEMVIKEPCVLVDYAHTPDALENVLLTLVHLKKQRDTPSRIWVVFGCGGDRDRTKRPEMGLVASRLADQVMITSDNPRTEEPDKIVDEIVKGIIETKKVQTILDRKEAIQQVLQLADKQDIILIAGKGHEAYQQIGHQRIPFSDQAIVRAFFGIDRPGDQDLCWA